MVNQRKRLARVEQLDRALLQAAEQGSLPEITSLLDRYADINAHDHLGYSALHHASSKGHHQCVELLLERRSDVHASGNENRPIHLAAWRGHRRCLELLLDGHANVDDPSTNDSTPLHLASSNGQYQCLELLLDRHADIDARMRFNKYVPLHLASSKGHHQCVEILLDRHADVDARDRYNNTPLHLASSNDHGECIEILIDRGADQSLIDVRVSLTLMRIHQPSSSSRNVTMYSLHSTLQNEGRTPIQCIHHSSAALLIQCYGTSIHYPSIHPSIHLTNRQEHLNIPLLTVVSYTALHFDWYYIQRTSSMEHPATSTSSQGRQGPRAHDRDDSIDCVVVVDLSPSERTLVLNPRAARNW